MKTYRFLFIACFLISAKYSNLLSQSYNFKNISLEDGLPQAQVNCILEDTRGVLWFGTQGGGAAMYDGVTFKIFDEQSGLNGSIVTAIEEDKSGSIWMGSTWGGITRYDGKKFYYYSKEDGLFANGITALACDKYNRMYVASSGGLNLIDNRNISPLKQDIFNSKNTIQKILRDNLQNLWFLTQNELYLYNYFEWINISRVFKIKDPILAMAQDHSGNIWFATKKGLFFLARKDNGSYEVFPYSKNSELNNVIIQHIVFDKRNDLWICTHGFGVGRFDGNKLSFFNRKSGFKSNAVITVCEDRNGNLWFGTNGSGVIKYNPCPFVYYDNIDGLDQGSIFALLADRHNRIWAAPLGTGLIRYDGEKIQSFVNDMGSDNLFIRTIIENKKGEIWFGGNGGLYSITNDKVSKADFFPGGVTVRSLLSDKDNSLWIGTSGNGLYHYSKGKLIHYSDSAGLTHPFIHALCQDRNGRIWAGTGGGVFLFSDNKFKSFKYSSGFCNDYIGSIAADSIGNVWFGTDRCLVRYNGNEFRSFSQADGLASPTIFSLIVDKSGKLWVGSNKGLDCITISNSGEFKSVRNYSYYEGFKGIEVNSRSVSMDSSGNLFYGTIKGVIKYLPKLDVTTNNKPLLHITDFQIFSQTVDFEKQGLNTNAWYHLPEKLELPYYKNSINIKYVGINLSAPQKIRYEYKLEGMDKDWVKTNETQANYTNLQPGNYIFKIRAFSLGSPERAIVQYAFKITPPFWRTPMFILLMLVILVGATYLGLRYRVQHIRLENKRLEDQIQVRTNEILKQKNEIEVLFKEVHHRVKNNLQVINSLLNLQKFYISDHKMIEVFNDCQNRIFAMSVIHEKLYETNSLAKVNFDEYLNKLIRQLANTYTTQFEVKYDVKVNVQELDLDTLIPVGLLINEIISNSLKYAFEENGKKENIIYFQMEQEKNKNLIILIGDNGKGSSVEVNQAHTTFGLELVKMLVEQLQGSINRLPDPGTNYRIEFKALK